MSELSQFNKNLIKAMGTKTVDQPKMSVNKLGEFLVASPSRQRKIVEQLKYPKENQFAIMGYKDARIAIREYFINDFEESIILACVEKLEKKSPNTDFKKILLKSEIESLELILESENINQDLIYLPYTGDNPKLNISGVEVSVNPDLIVKNTMRGNEYIGGLKIHLSKNYKFGEEGSKYIATILYHYVENFVDLKGCKVRNSVNLSYDVFTDMFVICPNSVKKRWGDINAACLTIVAIWNSI